MGIQAMSVHDSRHGVSSLPETFASRWRVLAILAVCVVLTMTPWFSATAIISQLREAWGLSNSAAAWLTIAVQIGFVIGAVGASALGLSDMVPPKTLMVAGAAGAAAANGCILLAEDVWTAIGLRMLTGVFLAGVYPPALKLVATWFASGRGLALGTLVGALTLGSAAPHLINGVGGLQWDIVIASTTAATLVGGVIVALFVQEGPYPFPRAAFRPRQAMHIFRNRGIVLASLGYFGHMWELYAMWAWYLAFAREYLGGRGHDGQIMGSLLSFTVIAMGALGCVAGGLFGDRWGRTALTSVMMALSGGCALVAGLAFDGPAWLFILIGLVWGFTVVADSAQFSAIVTEVGDPQLVGTALTLQLGLGFILTVPTIWLLPLAADLFRSWQWAFLILLPGPCLGIIAMLALRRLPEARRIAGGKR